MDRDEATYRVIQAQRNSGKKWSDIATAIGRSTGWTTSALLGQHSMSAEEASKAVAELGLDPHVTAALQRPPLRGAAVAGTPSDPLLYRLNEMFQVYGPAMKELIGELFGDGVMSAIDFKFDVKRVPNAAGDRVQITLDGKFLPYVPW
uniref:Cyanate hydratase n=1 Tax=Strigamia maritima TaxID=126957 RepID=T1J7W3_STRMM